MRSYQENLETAAKLSFQTRAMIDGEFVDSVSGERFETRNPANGRLIAEVARCDARDVDRAVASARRAFEDKRWRGLAPAVRKERLLQLSRLILEHANELAVMESLDSGKPIYDTAQTDIPETAACFAWHAEAIDKLEDSLTATDDGHVAMAVREPIGVVAAILPWNFPLQMAAWKLAPILAAGNSVVAKSARLTSLTLLKLAELALEAGIPGGVLNVTPGDGDTVGEALARHMDVDLITFTGSTAVGRNLLVHSGQTNLKRVLLELGGKNPCVVMPDVENLDDAAEQIVSAALWNMGENCTANSRIIVHRDIHLTLLEKLIMAAKKWNVGDPLNPENRHGALIDEKQLKKVLQYVDSGKNEGARLVYGGERILEETGGFFLRPTIFDDVSPQMTIYREEIFGPVFGISTFDTLDQAIRMANDTRYGLQASVWTGNLNTAHKLSRGIRAGTVSVNCYSEGDIGTPFGGFKESGFFGRDKSLWANRQYTELKTIWTEIK